MKKKLSIKEIVLFVILAVLLIFLYISRGPIASRRITLENDRADIQYQTEQVKPTIDQMNIWQEELDSIYAKYNGNPKSIPDYNNINAVIAEMSTIFDGDSEYTITFADPTLTDHIVTRNIRITFSCSKYDEMINKLIAINDSENRYRITDLSINEDSTNQYSASLGVVAYEFSNTEAE